ncbi:MAG: hypothetical protein IPI53_10065 [Saprospiraceae bacterium]|nr:hypothetical protein [Saprospiraceae bacterium]
MSFDIFYSVIDFIFKNATPNQITEAVIAIAPINTKTGGTPKYTSVNIPIGISKPVSANQEMVFHAL